jgi:hypothetical protein
LEIRTDGVLLLTVAAFFKTPDLEEVFDEGEEMGDLSKTRIQVLLS